MNIHQQHLLDLLKEVDTFCREHGITYYCAGGTVIGAARHRGFIPWDDDIDIYMTRENFARFAKALEEDGPADRRLEYYEGDHDRRAPVPRFHRDTDTMFCHFHLLGRSSAGTSLDVFILDPIPDDHESRMDYIAKLFAYCDLIAPCHVYSHRLPTSRFDVYDRYKKIADEQGVPRAVEFISDEIFGYDTSECSSYCLRWGSVILIYPIEAIGEPVYMPFEDMEIPVPQDWYRYLVVHYGMDWIELPYEEVQGEHINIVRYDMKYDYFYEKRDSLYKQEELIDLHDRWKEAQREFFRTAESIDRSVMEIQNRLCRAEIDKRLGKALEEVGLTSQEELFTAGKYRKIIDAYAPYFERQLSHAYMGRNMKHGTQFRWIFPFIMPLGEDEMRMLLTSMLRSGQHRTVEKLAGIYRRGNVKSEAMSEAAAVIDLINSARGLYYRGDYAACMECMSSRAPSDMTFQVPSGVSSGMSSGAFSNMSSRAEPRNLVPALSDLQWLCEVQTGISDERAAELEVLNTNPGTAAAAARKDRESREAERKAYGDLLWKRGRHEEAGAVYRELMKTCRNGLFWLDIQSKVPGIDPIPTKRLTPFTDTALTRAQRELLEEIAAICSGNGIKYVIGPDLARRIHLTGNMGYINANREVFMDAENALKFMEAFEASGRQDRDLLSWKNGDSIRDFALIYSDRSKVFCDFRRLDQWRDMGIFITIRILRSSAAPKSYRRKTLLDEFTSNLMSLEQIDRRNLQSAGKKLLYARTRLMTPGRRADFGRRLFERSIAAESGADSGGFYYYTNVRGMKPARHAFARSLWEDTSEAVMNGVSYTIPKAVTERYVPREADLANVPPINSVFIYSSDEMSWEEISPLIDDEAYAALDWDRYAATRRRFRKISDKVWHAWWMVLKLGEELDLNEAAKETIRAYRAALEHGSASGAESGMVVQDSAAFGHDGAMDGKAGVEAAADAMREVDAVVKKYAALNVPIDLTPELRECYGDYLNRSGQTEFLKALAKLPTR